MYADHLPITICTFEDGIWSDIKSVWPRRHLDWPAPTSTIVWNIWPLIVFLIPRIFDLSQQQWEQFCRYRRTDFFCKFFVNSWKLLRALHSAGVDVSRVKLCWQSLRSLVHRCVCSESHDDRSFSFSRGATKKRWYRRPEDDDHDVSHTPTGRLHREEGRKTREAIVRAGDEKVGVGKKSASPVSATRR